MTQFTAFQPQGLVFNPTLATQADGSSNPFGMGKQGEALISELRGKYGIANYRGVLFTANVTAVTIPVNAATLVSVFSLFNPATSGIIMELVDFDFAMVLATTVVDAIGLYFSTNWQSATFTTKGTPQSGQVGAPTLPKGQFYSALTHSGTPVRHSIIGSFGATTNAGGVTSEPLDGKIMIPPGTIASVAMSTAAGTASGLDLGATWIELPI